MDETELQSSSSPPPSITDTETPESELKTSKKRSHEDMNATQDGIPASSQTFGRPTQPLQTIPDASQIEPPSSAPVPTPSQQASTAMGPPQRPASATAPTSQQAPTSAQGPTSHQPQANRSAPSVKTDVKHERHNETADEPMSTSDTDSPSSSPSNAPEDPIEDLNWTSLEVDYHQSMDALTKKEQDILVEFNSLTQVSCILDLQRETT